MLHVYEYSTACEPKGSKCSASAALKEATAAAPSSAASSGGCSPSAERLKARLLSLSLSPSVARSQSQSRVDCALLESSARGMWTRGKWTVAVEERTRGPIDGSSGRRKQFAFLWERSSYCCTCVLLCCCCCPVRKMSNSNRHVSKLVTPLTSIDTCTVRVQYSSEFSSGKFYEEARQSIDDGSCNEMQVEMGSRAS